LQVEKKIVLQSPMSDANRPMPVRSFKVDISQIGYVRWCLESHDGIGNPTTPDIIDLTIAPDYLVDAEALIAALEKEIGIAPVPPPADSPLLRTTDG
jgi:hypothetical protein